MPGNDDQQQQQVSSRVLDLGSIFAAPLVSVIKADVLAAREFTGFLSSFGFVNDGNGESGTHLGALKTVTFSYKRPGPNGELQDAVVEIPLLSLVPLPLLQVTDAEFTFNVHVLESDSGALGAPPPLVTPPALRGQEGGENAPQPPPAPQVRAMLAPAPPATTSDRPSSQRSLDANMTVKLAMKQADVPAGISALLQLMGEAVNSSTTRKVAS